MLSASRRFILPLLLIFSACSSGFSDSAETPADTADTSSSDMNSDTNNTPADSATDNAAQTFGPALDDASWAYADDYPDAFTDCLHYSDFGAVGDGQTNDMEAIILTHDTANAQGRCVQADEGAVYYIAQISRSAIIMTSTDWHGAKFIIDDSQISTAENERGAYIFSVNPTTGMIPLLSPENGDWYGTNLKKVSRHQQNLGFQLGQDMVAVLYDLNTKRYIREGVNENDGAAQMDIFILRKDGSVAPETPIMWDYNQITHLFLYPIDDQPILLRGGEFTTIANQAESAYNYYNRGILIQRSNVTVDRLTHRIEGELNHGAPYNGFLIMQYAANITVKNSIFTGHKMYWSGLSQMGSYDIQPIGVMNLTFDHCRQTNDINNGQHWGLMGSNYCKNIRLNNCSFSRFDAHQGVVDVTIENCDLGYQGLRLVGEGTLTIKNTAVHDPLAFIMLRNDYGSSWIGDFKIENCAWQPLGGLAFMPVIYSSFTGNHYFGYDCSMPTTIDIDGLRVEGVGNILLLSDFSGGRDPAAFSVPYGVPQIINIANFSTSSNDGWYLSSNMKLYENVQVNLK